MGLFDKQIRKQMESLSLKELEEMRDQGLDVDEYLEAAYKKQANEEALLDTNQIDITRLAVYENTPRSDTSEFFCEVAKKVPMFNKRKWQVMYVNAPIVYAGIVQANQALYSPGKTTTGAVALIVLDEKMGKDIAYINTKAEEVYKVAYGQNVPKDMRKIAEGLRKQEGYFTYRLPTSISDGYETWVCVFSVDQNLLPKTFIPKQRIIPCLLLDDLKEKKIANMEVIPSKFYEV